MNRDDAIARAQRYFDDGGFQDDLARRVAIPSTSQDPDHTGALRDYLADELVGSLEALGFSCAIFDNAVADAGPFLIAERIENPALLTVLTYGHGDTVRGQDDSWRDGLSPWEVVLEDGRFYGRGTADNKGQHTINLGALAAVLAERGKLGFNLRVLIETGEEKGSPGLRALCNREKDNRLKADLFLASDGPRLTADQATIFLGARGVKSIDLSVSLREGAHHSGNWGGLLANPGIILAHALASITDARGAIQVPEWRPPLPDAVRTALEAIEIEDSPDGPAIDPDWGEPGLTPSQRVFGWNSFEVLAFTTGRPEAPVNAIPPDARAHCQLRYVVGTDEADIVPALRRHLDRAGFSMVEVGHPPRGDLGASRIDPDDPWVTWSIASIARTIGNPPAVLPNLGGSLPNDIFSLDMGLRTIWVPHSYAACSQHAPDEHLLASVAREGLGIMAGLFWDLGEAATLPSERRNGERA
jgi:acetylornithine deacetylase/succinyl-diaminopimelate desuccinylase-like protein